MRTPTTVLVLALAFIAGQMSTRLFQQEQTPSLVNTSYAQFGQNQGGGFEDFEISNDTIKLIRAANESLQTAMEALRIEGKYEAATKSTNAFLVLTGGGNAMAQLDAGLGVDPETYAGLYAGDALPEVADYLAFDAEGRLTYKNQLVRIMPVKDLKSMYEMRGKILTSRLKAD